MRCLNGTKRHFLVASTIPVRVLDDSVLLITIMVKVVIHVLCGYIES